jgi:hypothetical protein
MYMTLAVFHVSRPMPVKFSAKANMLLKSSTPEVSKCDCGHVEGK